MDDLISRQAAIDAGEEKELLKEGNKALKEAIERLKGLRLPSAQQVVKGKWEWDDDGMDWGLGSWRCSRCHVRPETTWQTKKDIVPLRWSGSKFCPNCGADMRGEKDE